MVSRASADPYGIREVEYSVYRGSDHLVQYLLRSSGSMSSLAGFARVCPRCDKTFFICTSCDRGRWYCSQTCSKGARSASLIQARKKYLRSEKGRNSNRRSQVNYRKKHKNKNTVRHQSSQTCMLLVTPQSSVASEPQRRNVETVLQLIQEAKENSNDQKEWKNILSGQRPCCCMCRRMLVYIHSPRIFASKARQKSGVANDDLSANSC